MLYNDLTITNKPVVRYSCGVTKYIVVDLKTLSSAADGALLAVSFCAINTENAIDGYVYMPINVQSCLDLGARIDASMLSWWMERPGHIRDGLAIDDGTSITAALTYFDRFLSSAQERRKNAGLSSLMYIWSYDMNTKDQAMLEWYMRKLNMAPVWKPYQWLSIRTLRSVSYELHGQTIYGPEKNANYHYGLADVLFYAEYVRNMRAVVGLE